ncbi:S8 family serine peptidase [Shewanella sp. 4_MG-2023]|uniref:S8 family serine peptidase n=1 Tax=Shewanella sp. 4_MG-2023 TaxID=3062652 RepID=UPI0026E26926|nr:S8 family serine peptidase [Shewanella sp. 4_MG-2023]MDO6678325.1 S8 family serine peptidase [Shewanella sp. 4_MG-2023]
MKLSSRYLVLSAVSSVLAFSSHADSGKPLNSINPGQEKIKLERAGKMRTDGLYFVRLKDSALASYDGSVTGYAATSIKSNQSNKTTAGVLNLKSQASVSYKRYLESKQTQITQRLSGKLNRTLKPTQQYQVVANAFALQLDASEVKTIQKDQDVYSVEPVGMHYIQTSTGPEFIGAKKVWQGVNDIPGTKGEGIIVGIMDTGINATHPSFKKVGDDGHVFVNPNGENQYFGDCQQYPEFCNNKLIGIVSYPELVDYRASVADNLDDPSYDDLADKAKVGYDFHGHGSHVASTAAGNVVKNVNYYLQVEEEDGNIIAEKSAFEFPEISGVAPHANIVSYQVCDDVGSCYPEFTIQALEHAIENGVQVLNYSVGGSATDPWDSVSAEAFLNAREAGIHVATAAGNAGPTASTIGSPGNAPWVTTVAAYSHNLSFDEKGLTDFTSVGGTSLADLSGRGVTKGFTGKVVQAKDYDEANAMCTEPFEADTFTSDQIVVCERGLNARVRKGIIVRDAGAGGMILINLEGGADTVNDDNHVLPAIHLNDVDGQLLTDWLATGTDHQAAIAASVTSTDDSLGDIAGAFTSRGPNLPYPNIFAPDIAGPGVDIYAANAEDRVFEGEIGHIPYVSFSGTSMASPHVAGALALIKSAYPQWTPAQAQMAIMSTAYQVTYQDDDYDGVKQRSDFFTQGAGSIRINDALKAGLLMDITKEEYLAANPSIDGNPGDLNTSSMVNNECISNCTWTRKVTATKSSNWTVGYEYLNDGFTFEVSPSSFALNAGESQVLTIKAIANAELVDEWVHGYINLKNSADDMSDTHLQATIGFKAGQIVDSVSAKLNNLDNTIEINDIVTSGSNDLQVNGFGLFKSQSFSGTAIGASNDVERNSPAYNQEVLFTTTTVVKPYTKRLVVEITDTTSPDMDLYVGIDENNDGKADASELYYSLVCISGEIDSNEQCIIPTPTTGNYWILAHNYEGTVADEPDDVTVRVTHVNYSSQASFDIDAPSTVAQDEEFDVSMTVNGYLDDSQTLTPLEEGEVYYGLLELGTTSNLVRNIGGTLIKVEGLAPVEVPVNTAPTVANPLSDVETELTDSGSVAFSVDLTDVFADAENDTLTYSVSGLDTLSIDGMSLSGSLTEAGTFEIKVTATDGELSAFSMFTLTVAAAPEVIPPVIEEPTKSSSGGAMGMGWMMLLIMACIRQRKRVQK